MEAGQIRIAHLGHCSSKISVLDYSQEARVIWNGEKCYRSAVFKYQSSHRVYWYMTKEDYDKRNVAKRHWMRISPDEYLEYQTDNFIFNLEG